MNMNLIKIVFFVLLIFFTQGCQADDSKNVIRDAEEHTSHNKNTLSEKHQGKHEWNLYGSYKVPFQADCRDVEGKIYKCPVSNILEIKRLDDDSVKISIGIIGGNLHQCQLEGIAHIKSGYLEIQEKHTDIFGKDRECVLRIKREGENIVLYDELDRNCKRQYCGQRAGFTGKKFLISD